MFLHWIKQLCVITAEICSHPLGNAILLLRGNSKLSVPYTMLYKIFPFIYKGISKLLFLLLARSLYKNNVQRGKVFLIYFVAQLKNDLNCSLFMLNYTKLKYSLKYAFVRGYWIGNSLNSGSVGYLTWSLSWLNVWRGITQLYMMC